MSSNQDLERLESRAAEIEARTRADGKPTVRQRAKLLVDAGTLREVGGNAGVWEGSSFVPANFLLALGRIDKRPVVVGGEDFSIKGGSPNLPGLRKSRYCEELALELRVPLIRLHEGAGGSVAGAKGSPATKTPKASEKASSSRASRGGGGSGEAVNDPHRFRVIARCFETVPVASAVLGSVAGLPAVRVAASHFAVMVKGSALLVAGARVVEQARGGGSSQLSKEELGGARVHLHSGVIDAVVETEAEAMRLLRRFLSYLPPNAHERPPQIPERDARSRRDERLRTIVPADRQKSFAMREVLLATLDSGSFFELKRGMASSIIVGFGRLLGRVVGVVANDPMVRGGAMTALAAQKFRAFGELCERFHIPLIHFVDEPGFMVGEEDSGMLLHGARAAHFAALCSVPTATVLIRRCFGVATYCHYGSVTPLVLAWPSSRAGPMPVQAGVEAAFKRQLQQAEDPEALRRYLEDEAEKRLSPWARAESFSLHDIIDPSDTRPRLCDWLDSVEHRLTEHVLEARSVVARSFL
eukprot:TRINITY_DN47748_c0_g1_i1.p1 TRINITY_DN47748_c0_g1~~TRINITY_DN47748_c0_g1_i1.p1  ORF type:complete len:528 (-),score=96.20 TRINITY_DN47748_c0_g1_i1:144-1727(-)